MMIRTLKEFMDCRSREIVKKPKKKVERCGETSEKFGNYPVDLPAGCHTMFFCRDLAQNEILGGTQTALLRTARLGDNKRHRTSDNKNCINLNPICFGLDVKLYNPEAKDAAAPDNVLFQQYATLFVSIC